MTAQNPYKPPSAQLSAREEPCKRPLGVWVITIFYAVGWASALATLGALIGGFIPIDPATVDYFASLTLVDYFLTVATVLVGLCAVVTLFLLKPVTVKIWIALLCFDCASFSYYQLAATPWRNALGSPSFNGAILTIIVDVLAVLYALRLSRNGCLPRTYRASPR